MTCWNIYKHPPTHTTLTARSASGLFATTEATLHQTVPMSGEAGTECVLLGRGFREGCVAMFGQMEVPTKYWYVYLCVVGAYPPIAGVVYA